MQHRGRLAVFSPDGPIQNFFIEKPTVAIGRSSGNDLMLDRHGISRYHASLTINEADRTAELRDLESVNGTYVDGIRLKPNEARILRGGEEIQISDLRLILHPAADDTTDQTIQVRLQSADESHLSVELEGPNIAVTPGTHAPATISLVNRTTEKMRIVLRIEGVPPLWARLDQTEFDLQPDQQREVGISFKPVRRFDTKPGIYNVTLHIGTIDTAYPPIELHTRLQILQFNGYGAVMGTPIIENGGTFLLYVHNQGNGPLPLRFMGRDPDQVLTYDIHPTQLILDAGQRVTIQGHVQARQRALFGKSERITYDIITQSLSPSAFVAPVSGQVEVVPMLSNWRVPLGLGVALIIGVLLMVGLLFSQTSASDDPDPAMPQINSFLVNNNANAITTEINAPILVQWQTEDAVVVYLSALHETGEAIRYALAAQAPNGHVLYLPNVGIYTLNIDAGNGDKTVSSKAIMIEVVPRLRLTVTTAAEATSQDAPVLYQNVTGQQLIVRWEANWGTLSPMPLLQLMVGDQRYPITNTIGTLTVEPTGPQNRPDDIDITLGTETETLASMTLPVLYPECVNQRAITIYDTPDVNSPSLPMNANTLFQVDGQNANRWVRVILPLAQIEFGYWGWIAPEAARDLQCSVNYDSLGQISSE